MGTLALILVPAALFVAVAALVVGLRRGAVGTGPTGRLGWPARWVLVWTALLLLGVVVAPRLLGFTFLLLPFLWIGRAGRRRRGEGRLR